MNDANTRTEVVTPSPLSQAAVFLATGAGVGFLPWMPGTFGSLMGLPLAWAVGSLSSFWEQAFAILALLALGIPICSVATTALNRGKDPGAIIWDEIVCIPVVFLGHPMTITTALLGFLLFRLFDSTKFWPSGSAEKLPDGWGIMADDLVAGAYSNLALMAVLWYWQQ